MIQILFIFSFFLKFHFDRKIKTFQSDGDGEGEFISIALIHFSFGLVWHCTTTFIPYTHEPNDLVEIKHRHIVETKAHNASSC